MTQPTPEEVEKYVTEYRKKFGVCNEEGVCDCHKELKWLRTTLTTVYHQGVKDTLAGVPEESDPRGPWESAESMGWNDCRAAVIKHGEELLEGKK